MILVAEDDQDVAGSLEAALTRDGHTVVTVTDGVAALYEAGHSRPDLIVLDVLMPRLDGLEVCRRLRAAQDATAILMLTARDLIQDRVAGLDAGADDYLVKPFALDELRARVRALLRRASGGTEVLEFQDVRMDLRAATVTRADRRIPVTRTEYALLEAFLRHPGRVLTAAQLVRLVWGHDYLATSQALWVHMSSLRGKLEAGGEARVLHTVRGLGYVLREQP
jgi:two-component system, OmpR family, response regulator MprA